MSDYKSLMLLDNIPSCAGYFAIAVLQKLFEAKYLNEKNTKEKIIVSYFYNETTAYPIVTYWNGSSLDEELSQELTNTFIKSEHKGFENKLLDVYKAMPKPYKLYLYSLNNQGDIRSVVLKYEEVRGLPYIYDFAFMLQKPANHPNPDEKWYWAGGHTADDPTSKLNAEFQSPLLEKYIPDYSIQHVEAIAFRMYPNRHYGEEKGVIPLPPPAQYYKKGYIITASEAIEVSLEIQSMAASLSGLFPVALIESGALITTYTYNGKLNKANTELAFTALDAFLTAAPALKLGLIIPIAINEAIILLK